MKKGFTLIELITVICAAGIIATVMVSVILTNNSIYTKKTREHRDYFYSMEALMFIQNEVRNAKAVHVENNVIELSYIDESIKKLIKLNNRSNLAIIHMEKNFVQASNNIITGIEYFEVFRKNNLIYLSITRTNGETYEKCISINSGI